MKPLSRKRYCPPSPPPKEKPPSLAVPPITEEDGWVTIYESSVNKKKNDFKHNG